jgi:hypothetical protein
MHICHIRNFAITTAMVWVIGCVSQQEKLSSPSAIQSSDAGAEFLRLIAAEDAKNPILKDEDLIASFQKHRAKFDQLQQMIATDSKLHRVDEDWTDPHDPKDAGVSTIRIENYRRLLVEAGCRRGFAAFPGRPGIYFISAAQGTVASSLTQGYYYSEGAPQYVVSNTMKYSPKHPEDSYEVFRHIDGHWYIYFNKDL